MSTTDLSILADAVTFAILVAIGGAIAYAVARATWKRHSLHPNVRMALSGLALVAVGFAGVALWPTARDTVTTAADIAGFETANTTVDDPLARIGDPTYTASPPKGRPARVFQAAPYTPGGIDLTPEPDPTYTSSTSGPDPTEPTDPDDPPTNPPTSPPTPPTSPPTTPPPTTTTPPPPTTTTETPPPPPPTTTTETPPPPPPTTTTEPPPPPPTTTTEEPPPPPSDTTTDSPTGDPTGDPTG
jgi:hypothetical protein